MKVYIENFSNLHFTEAIFGKPIIKENSLIIPVRNLLPLGEHPICNEEFGPINGRLKFKYVCKSERKILEYVGDPEKPEGFKEERIENDGPFSSDENISGIKEYGFEGGLETPPAWVDWVIYAKSFTLEVDKIGADCFDNLISVVARQNKESDKTDE